MAQAKKAEQPGSQSYSKGQDMRVDSRLSAIGNYLERAFRENGLTKTAVAELLDVPNSYVTRLISGQNMTLETVLMIQDKMGIQLLSQNILIIKPAYSEEDIKADKAMLLWCEEKILELKHQIVAVNLQRLPLLTKASLNRLLHDALAEISTVSTNIHTRLQNLNQQP